MKTLADIKRRLTVGTRIVMTFHKFGAVKLVDVVRQVTVAKPTQVAFAAGDGPSSYLCWPKAKDVRATGPDTFDILMGEDASTGSYKADDVFMSYRILS